MYQQRLENNKRQEERHRQKVLANRSNCADNSRKEVDSDNQITLVKTMAALNIWLNVYWAFWWEKQRKPMKINLLISKLPSICCYCEIVFCGDCWAYRHFFFTCRADSCSVILQQPVWEKGCNPNKKVGTAFHYLGDDDDEGEKIFLTQQRQICFETSSYA